MANNLTRIKNNQITDGTIQSAKLASGTLVGTNFSNNLTLNSNVTIIGNLSVGGNTSTINSVNTYIQDPLVTFNNGYTGSLTNYDIGLIINRNWASLAGYGSVNTAFVWDENAGAFLAIATTTSGNAITGLTNSGFANVKVGNLTANSLTITTGGLTATNGIVNTPISGSTGSFTTLSASTSTTTPVLNATNGNITTLVVTTGFSTSNAQITGGNISGDFSISGTTGQFTNFSTGNAVITGGSLNSTPIGATSASTGAFTQLAGQYVNATTGFATANAVITGGSTTGMTSGSFTTLQGTNLSSGNAQITGGAISATPISGSTGYFTTAQATNFSSSNVLITGGNVNGNYGQFTNFSTGNAQITGGSATFTQLAGAYVNATTGFATANAQITGGSTTGMTGGSFTTLQGTNFSTGNAQITGGSATFTQLAGAYVNATTGFATANAVITGGSTTGMTSGTYTTLQATNFSSGNSRIASGYADNFPIGANTRATGAFTSLATNGVVTHTGSIDATSTTTGQMQVTGGVGITGNLWVGGNLYALNVYGATQNTVVIQDPLIYLQALANLSVYNYDIGFYSDYTAPLYEHTGIARSFASNTWNFFSNVASEPTIGGINWSDAGLIWDTIKAGGVILANTTAASSTSTGALQVGGGAGIVGNLYAGNINTTGTATLSTVQATSIYGTFYGTVASTVTTANVSLYDVITASTTNGTFYPAFFDKSSGNGSNYVSTSLTYNPSTNTLTSPTVNSTYSNPTNLATANAVITGGSVNSTAIGGTTPAAGNFTTLQGTNFSTGNAVITGGSSTGMTSGTFTTLQATNFSTGNAIITGGNTTSMTAGSFTTLQGTNFSTGNAVITGGSLNSTPIGATSASTGAFTQLAGAYVNATTGFATANAQITGGTITGLTNLSSTTDVATNFSTGNAVITGGSVNGTTVGATTAAAGTFTNVVATGTIKSTGNLVANATTPTTSVTTGALVVVGGAGFGANVLVNTGANINVSKAVGADFYVAGANDNTIIWGHSGASYDSVIVGGQGNTATLATGAKFIVNSNDSMILPRGDNAGRPGSTVEGMFRYSYVSHAIEWWNGTTWQSASTSFTPVTDQTITADGTNNTFSMSPYGTTAGSMVSINGVLQIPTLAYSTFSGNSNIVFTEIPSNGDIIDIRILTSTTSVTSIQSSTGKFQFVTDDTAGASVYTGSSGATAKATTIWLTGGQTVSNIANVSVGSANTLTTVDTMDTTAYRSAKYIVQVTNGSSYQVQEALVISNGTTASIVNYGVVQTNGNLGVLTATQSGSNALVQFVAANASTTVRVSPTYLTI